MRFAGCKSSKNSVKAKSMQRMFVGSISLQNFIVVAVLALQWMMSCLSTSARVPWLWLVVLGTTEGARFFIFVKNPQLVVGSVQNAW